jgi:hypothetical protein
MHTAIPNQFSGNPGVPRNSLLLTASKKCHVQFINMKAASLAEDEKIVAITKIISNIMKQNDH